MSDLDSRWQNKSSINSCSVTANINQLLGIHHWFSCGFLSNSYSISVLNMLLDEKKKAESKRHCIRLLLIEDREDKQSVQTQAAGWVWPQKQIPYGYNSSCHLMNKSGIVFGEFVIWVLFVGRSFRINQCFTLEEKYRLRMIPFNKWFLGVE